MTPREPVNLSRRGFLLQACECAAVLAVLPHLPACKSTTSPPGFSVALSDVPDGARAVVLDDDLPIEIRREGDAVWARSLICTHQGCQVVWNATDSNYKCPCHEGIFDAAGRPVMGPPREALREFRARIEGDRIFIDTTSPEAQG